MWKLVIEDDESRRTAVPLTRDEYSIGRKEGNSIRLTERNVSREHVRLRKHQNGGAPTYLVEDLKSYNGVYVNGIRVATSQDLVNGDLIQIGDYRIIFQEDQPEPVLSEEAQAAAQAVPQIVQPVSSSVSTDFETKTTQPGANYRPSLLMERPNRLVMLVGPTPGVEYPLDRERLTIGRAEDAGISINHNSVSRLHCEIHSLGEGRYEIVDKGSSNGIRVNAADLKRGIIEAGDLIELGDVRLKFVAAGQIFVPGPNESQQLTAISDRLAPDPGVNRRKTGIVPFAIAGAVVALVVLGGFLAYWKHKTSQQQQDDNPSPSATASQIDMEQQILKDAIAMCTKDDCERAHIKATTGLRENSPLRESPDFQKLESNWADWMFAKADAEPDFAKRKDIYQRVSQTITVDKEHRKSATDRLEALDHSAISDPSPADSVAQVDPNNTTSTNPTASGGAVRTPPPGTRPSQTPPGTAHPPPPVSQATQTATAPKPPAQSDLERARQALLDNDPTRAKLLLYKKLQNGGTAEELNVLKQACKATNDVMCVQECKRKLGQAN